MIDKEKPIQHRLSDSELAVQEESRFVLWKDKMTSEVKIGKTLFDVSSNLGHDANQFKDIISRIIQRQIERNDKNAG